MPARRNRPGAAAESLPRCQANSSDKAGGAEVHPANNSMLSELEKAVELIADDDALTSRQRIELLQKAAMTRKNILQGDKAEREASGAGDDGPPGVVVVPVKVPDELWPQFAVAECQASRG